MSTREPVAHDVKCWPSSFGNVIGGIKPWEIRKNDRDYRAGDIITMQEYIQTIDKFTGRIVSGRISYVLYEGFGLPDGYCIMTVDWWLEEMTVADISEKISLVDQWGST